MVEDAIIYRRKTTSEKLLKFRECMKGAMKGKKFERMEDRFKEFFIQAKLCSGKAEKREDAERLCKEAHPGWYPQKMENGSG